MDLNTLKAHIDVRLDRMESKLDNHIERISGAERDIGWLKGHVRIVTTIVLAIAGFFAIAFFENISL
jgi:hypothetical protein